MDTTERSYKQPKPRRKRCHICGSFEPFGQKEETRYSSDPYRPEGRARFLRASNAKWVCNRCSNQQDTSAAVYGGFEVKAREQGYGSVVDGFADGFERQWI